MFKSVRGLMTFFDRFLAKKIEKRFTSCKKTTLFLSLQPLSLAHLATPYSSHIKMPPKAAPAHPKYEDMVKAAIVALKDRNGSSVPAITKYLGANFKLPENFKKILSTQLKNLVKSGKLLKVKASYKLGEALKKKPPKKKAPRRRPPRRRPRSPRSPRPRRLPRRRRPRRPPPRPRSPRPRLSPRLSPRPRRPRSNWLKLCSPFLHPRCLLDTTTLSKE